MNSLMRNEVAFFLKGHFIGTTTAGAVDLKQAAATVQVQYDIPPRNAKTNYFQHGLEILGFFFQVAAAGGVVTTPGVILLKKNGTEIALDSTATVTPTPVTDSAGTATSKGSSANTPATWSRLAWPGATAANGMVVYNYVADFFLTSVAIIYPIVEAGDVLTAVISTQGVDAGTQVVYPQLIVRPKQFQDPGVTTTQG